MHEILTKDEGKLSFKFVTLIVELLHTSVISHFWLLHPYGLYILLRKVAGTALNLTVYLGYGL